MSQKAALEFIGQLAVDSTLRDELTAALADTADPSEARAKAGECAAQHGFDVTGEELAQSLGAAERAEELTDDHLAQVSGGDLSSERHRRYDNTTSLNSAIQRISDLRGISLSIGVK